MKIVAEGLMDITIQSINLRKTDTWLIGLYKGCDFIGCIWDYKTENAEKILKAADDLFPKDLNDLEAFEDKFSDRVTYHDSRDYSYLNLTDVALEPLRFKNYD
jgi:hypothetical protein